MRRRRDAAAAAAMPGDNVDAGRDIPRFAGLVDRLLLEDLGFPRTLDMTSYKGLRFYLLCDHQLYLSLYNTAEFSLSTPLYDPLYELGNYALLPPGVGLQG